MAKAIITVPALALTLMAAFGIGHQQGLDLGQAQWRSYVQQKRCGEKYPDYLSREHLRCIAQFPMPDDSWFQ